ncbi:unnamed protein product [Camellia sinensis]
MDKSWMMINDRLKSKEYQQGVKSFIDFATKNLGSQDDIRCPCVDCLNGTKHSRKVVWLHLIRRGIACSYRTWVHHGEHVPTCHDQPSGSHKSKRTNEWIHPKCGEPHDEMVNLQVATTEAGTPLTREELSWQMLGQKKNCLRGFGIGPRPSLPYDNATRACDKHMEAIRAEMEVLREECEKYHKELMTEKEERQRDREEMIREREEMMKQVEEGKKAREAQQEQLNYLNNVVLRLTTLLQGSNSHRPI